MSTDRIEEIFRRAKQEPSDICEHIGRMRELGEQCPHITEFGVRTGVSTAAWIAARPKIIVCYDIQRCAEIDALEQAALAIGVAFVFRKQDVLQATIEPTDLLFIDTIHTYDQLRRELALHASKSRKYIVLHDTETFGEVGEVPGTRGLWPAVAEFLAVRSEWTVLERRTNNNGLTVLARRGIS
jgi:hypothetical protein